MILLALSAVKTQVHERQANMGPNENFLSELLTVYRTALLKSSPGVMAGYISCRTLLNE